MKSITCIYFSPTGGTKSIALALAKGAAEYLQLPMKELDITPPEARQKSYCFAADELVVIATPTYAGRIPNKILPELEKIIHGENTPAVCISVYGGRSNDEGLRELVLLSEKNGFNVIAASACVARHSMSRVLAAHRPSAEDFSALHDFGRRSAQKAVEAPSPVAIDRETPIAPYYRPFKEDMTPAVFLKAKPLTSDACIDCGACAAACPLASISFEDFRTVNGVCIKCHACVRICPTGAKYFEDEELLSHIRVLEKLFEGRQNISFII